MVEQLASVDWNIVLTYGLKILGYALGTILIALASIIFAKLKTKIGESRLNTFIDKMVRSAEQLFPNTGKKTGQEKYDYVVTQILSKFPKVQNNEHLKALIEAAVYSVSEEVKQIAKQKKEEKKADTQEIVEEKTIPTATALSIN